MRCYRLYENIPTHSALGFGLGSGRWNHAGTPLIYASNMVTLPFMELYSIKGPVVASSDWVLATLEIPDEIPELDIESLPQNWNWRPARNATKDFGTVWANTQQFLCLKIPSARIPLMAYPKECNILINPLHPDFHGLIKMISEERVDFTLDSL